MVSIVWHTPMKKKNYYIIWRHEPVSLNIYTKASGRWVFFFRLSCSAVALATQALHLKFIKLSRFVRIHQGHHNKCANIEYMLLISNSLVFPWIEFTGVSMNYVFSIFQLIIITGPFNWCDDFGDVEKKNWQLHSLLYRAVCACADLI